MGKIVYPQLLDKEKLHKLYWDDNLSTRDIAKLLGVNDHMSVLRNMKKFGIKTRKNVVKPQYLKSKLNIDGMKETDFAYLAGIIDGEGHIGIGELVPNQIVRVLNTSKTLIEWIANIFNTKVRISIVKPGVYNRKIYYVTSLQRHNDLIILLELIIPYLMIKKEIAITALNYLENHVNRNVKFELSVSP